MIAHLKDPSRGELGCAWVLVIAAFLAWACLALSGYDLYRHTRARVPNSPYLAGQFDSYVLLPFALALLAGAQVLVLRRVPKLGVVIGVTSFVLLAALPAFLIGYSGGV